MSLTNHAVVGDAVPCFPAHHFVCYSDDDSNTLLHRDKLGFFFLSDMVHGFVCCIFLQ
jgi:hypothetical protein